MTAKQVRFTTDAAIIQRLGRELVSRQETALGELVKNAYDADATYVAVAFVYEDGTRPTAIEVSDNGTGMDRESLENGFLRLASSLKVDKPRSPKYGRLRAGRKGIGRFAVERLGAGLVLTTETADATEALRLTVDWDAFLQGLVLEEVPIILQTTAPSGSHGTSLRIERPRDPWTDVQIRQCLWSVSELLQPYPVSAVDRESPIDPGFSAQFLRSGTAVRDELVIDLDTELLAHRVALVELDVNDHGHAAWRVSAPRLNLISNWKPIAPEHEDDPSPPPLRHVKNAALSASYFIVTTDFVPRTVSSHVRTVLAARSGIRLYRNGFRVPPYGERGNDWLGLDLISRQRFRTLAPIANFNFFGFVEMVDPDERLSSETTSREGLVETPGFAELRRVCSAALISAVNVVANLRGRVGASTERQRGTGTGTKSAAEDLKESAAALVEAAQQAAGPDVDLKANVQVAAERVTGAAETIAETQTALLAEIDLLRILASIGMAGVEFSHDFRMTFQAATIDVNLLLAQVTPQFENEDVFLQRKQRLLDNFTRADAFTAYFSNSVSAQNARTRKPVSLSRVIREFLAGMRPVVERHQLDVTADTPPLDPLFTTPMNAAEWTSILINLLTNAIKALKRSGGPQRILIRAERDEEHKVVRVLFCDSGAGIPIDIRERVFEPFFTTANALDVFAPDDRQATGTGLGLWIVRQIAEAAGGYAEIMDPPLGYNTCVSISVAAGQTRD